MVTIQWTGSGPDVLVRLDRSAHETLGSQLQRELREAIRTGRLTLGEKLPSSRRLATELGVSRGLVVEGYTQLEAEGYLTTRPGSATEVAIRPVDATPVSGPEPDPGGVSIDFEFGVPDLGQFPIRDWMWAMGQAARTVPFPSLGYTDPRGIDAVRTVIAAYLRRVRGGLADPDHVVITTGYAQGLSVVLGVLAKGGAQRVAIEDPGDPRNARAVRRHGLEPIPIHVDHDGIDVAALVAARAEAVIVTPAHQCPTGSVLTAERRLDLLEWAAKSDGLVIEDDYDSEFRYDRRPVGSLHGLDPDHVIALGSVSKSLAPFLRLGWIVAPGAMAQDISDEKQLTDRATAGLEQLALAEMIRSGRYDRHIRRMRTTYSRRRQALIEATANHLPGCDVTGLAAGFHAVIETPGHLDEEHLVAEARRLSVGIYGMSTYRFDGSSTPCHLVLGFGNLTDSAIHRAIATIAPLVMPPGA